MIYFLRHADRDVTDRSLDNGLSDKGWEQCEDIVAHFKKQSLRFDEIRSSPKIRCLQTTNFVAKAYSMTLSEDWCLDEAGSISDREFLDRIVKMLGKLQREKRTLLLGTHGDVLDVILRWGNQSGSIHKGDLLVWNPQSQEWKINPIRGR